MLALRKISALVIGDTEADRTVPKSGFTAWLSAVAAAAMVFLAAIALGFAATGARVAAQWEAGLAHTATVRLPASAQAQEDQLAAVLRTLETTPGVASARVISTDEQHALLAPWLGEDLPVGVLKLPVLVELTETGAGPDRDGLVLRLAGEAPDAVYDDHSRWRQPRIAAANRMKWVSLVSLAMIAIVLAAIVALAVQAALSANARVIETLRLIGARDTFVVRAFVRRYTLRTLGGAVLGAAAGGLAVLLAAVGDTADAANIGPGLVGTQWLAVAALPILAGVIAFIVARITTLRNLRRLP